MTGEQLREIREKLGLTQDKMAEALGFSGKNYVYRMEKGDAPITKRTEKLVQALVAQRMGS